MARSRRPKPRKPASAQELAASTPSAVAVAAFQRSGAGSHGPGHGVRGRRQERRSARRALRSGSWD